MEELYLDPEVLVSTARIIISYCKTQKEIIESYYFKICALESEWKDDKTIGSLINEIKEIKMQLMLLLEEINLYYPKYFTDKANDILSRPSMSSVQDKSKEGLEIIRSNLLGPLHSSSLKSQLKIGLFHTKQSVCQSILPNGHIANIFDHPNELAVKLYSSQGNNSYKMDGTCSLVSSANILIISGREISEQQIVDYARNNNLCSNTGGTDPRFIRLTSLWKYFGMTSTTSFNNSAESLATIVESGRGVVISVDSDVLWDQGSQNYYSQVDHAITVTSTARDVQTGELIGFYICDSGRCSPDDGGRFVSIQLMNDAHFNAVGHGMIYTNNIIW